jgi:hypothetical protein
MTLRWRRAPRLSGLASVGQGERDYELREDGETILRVCKARDFGSFTTRGWFFAGRVDGQYVNTCDALVSTAEEAKENADAWVRKIRPPRRKR